MIQRSSTHIAPSQALMELARGGLYSEEAVQSRIDHHMADLYGRLEKAGFMLDFSDGGNLHQSRHYSQFLSLQLKARYEGLDTPVYQQAAVHHLR